MSPRWTAASDRASAARVRVASTGMRAGSAGSLPATIGWDGRGKRLTRRAHGRTKTEAKEHLRELLRQYEAGVTTGRHAYTVKEAVEDWLAFGLGRQAPIDNHEVPVLVQQAFIPLLGARKLRDLTAREVEAWLGGLASSLSSETLRRTHACLNRAVRRAMSRDWVSRNVVELAEVPSGRDGRPSKSLTPQQVDAILTVTAPHRMHNYIVLSLLTGARTEELRALRWSHVHLERPKWAIAKCHLMSRSGDRYGPPETPRRDDHVAHSLCPPAASWHFEHSKHASRRTVVRPARTGRTRVSSSPLTGNCSGCRQRSAWIPHRSGSVPDLDPAEWTPRDCGTPSSPCCPTRVFPWRRSLSWSVTPAPR